MAQRKRNFSLTMAGHAAQAAGFYRVGHIIRAVNAFGVGAGEAGGAAAAGETAAASGAAAAGLTGLAAAAGPVVLALGGLMVAAKLVEVGFGALEHTATELVGSIAQIGGARGLQQMFVESVSNDKLANQARFAVTGAERMSKTELMSMVHGLSQDATAGAFQSADWLQAIKSIGVISGQQRSLSKEDLRFIGQYAMVGGTDVNAAADVFGRILAKNPSMSNEAVRNVMLAGHAIGQTGSFNIGELPEAGKLMQLSGAIGGMGESEKLTDLFSIGTILKPSVGNLSTAGVQLNAFLKQARVSQRNGSDMFKFNEAGQITNLNQAIEGVVNTPNANLNQHLMTGRSQDFIRNIREGISQKAGVQVTDFSPEANQKRKEVLEDFEHLHMSLADFIKEVDDSITPQEKFKAAFNKIADNLEEKFLDVLVRLEPVIDSFADRIVANKDEIGDYFQQLAVWLAVGVEAFPSLMAVIGDLASAIGKAIVWILSHIPGLGMPSSKAEAEKALASAKEDLEWAKRHPDRAKERGDVFSGESGMKDIENRIVKAEENLKMFTDFEKLSSDNLKAMRERAEAQEKKEEEDRKARKSEEEANRKALEHSDNKAQARHEQAMTLEQKKAAILADIEKNTRQPPPPPPKPPTASVNGH